MVGTPVIAAWIAHIAFWVVLVWGWATGELGVKTITTFLILWLIGVFGLPYFAYGTLLFPSYVALLDIVLVLVTFKSDVPLSP